MTLTPEDIAAGWVEWGGGAVDADPAGSATVDIMTNDGTVLERYAGNELDWRHAGAGDIIAYRIVQPAAEKGREV
jgi:hypothetical protein